MRYRLAPHWYLNLAMLLLGWGANLALSLARWGKR